MGVQGLWELLAPVGRRVSVETLAGKRLAIDASIWMVQFMKAMRDDKGEMVRNAHLLGFFRRICKLLFLRAKPVFVFDGATPALKRRTIAARRRHRDNARAKIRKTAEKLLLNHLKAKKLEELAAEIKKQREESNEKQMNENVSKGKNASDSIGETGAETSNTVTSGDKGFGVSTLGNLDELLAASLAAEEDMHLNKNGLAASRDGLDKEEADDAEDEEVIFPIDNDHLDPTVLASLPPSMQLDLLVQMRERVMAENRQRYQKIKKAPSKFSELQIQSYLKTIAFRREIDEVQKSAAGRGLAGVQTSRIASEANREFIFSSSFTGDKQMLTSKRIANNVCEDNHATTKPSTSNSKKFSFLASRPKLLKEVSDRESAKDFGPDVETYHDENGHLRVSRVRGLGIRMTRDLQRNLDLMEEYEQEKRKASNYMNPEGSCTQNVDMSIHSENLHPSSVFVSDKGKVETSSRNRVCQGSEDAIEISFSEDDNGMNDTEEDNIFMQLVSEGQITNSPSQCVHSDKNPDDSESDSMWSEGLVEDYNGRPNIVKEIAGSSKIDYKENHTSFTDNTFEETGIEWEEGVCHDTPATISCQGEPAKHVSRGLLEEEANMQEAIWRSLGDFKYTISAIDSPIDKDLTRSIEHQSSNVAILHNLTESTSMHLDEDSMKSSLRTYGTLDSFSKNDDVQITGSAKKSPETLGSSDLSNLHLKRDSSLEKKDENGIHEMLTDDIPLGKSSDADPSWQEQSIDASNEEFGEISPNTNINITNDGSKSAIGKSSLDVSQVSGSDLVIGKIHNNSDSENISLIKERGASTCTEQHHATEGTYGTSNLIGDQNAHNPFYFPVEISEDSLDKEISLLKQERANLGNEQRILERNAESVSNEMFAECQELLQMFGLPYIIATMEAEAQCAYMEMQNLVDGVVTDDSDVFLFGARSVFKNIFDDRKYVETYFMKDIESELGLDREKLIRMAMLLGSDYTEGVSGIGIVNAIEVVHAFPEEDGLHKFREWVESPDPTILRKIETGGNTKRRSLKENNSSDDATKERMEGDVSEQSVPGGNDNEKSAVNGDIKVNFMNKHRNVSKNWHIPSSFPSESVVNAYTSPEVDESTDPFTWGKPDLPLLRKLCWEKFGWTNLKADDLLVPVLKEYNKHETQLRLEAFYTFNERFAKIRSQRIKKALKGITGTLSVELTDDLDKEGRGGSEKSTIELTEVATENSTGDNSRRGKIVLQQSRRRRESKKKNLPPEDIARDPLIAEEEGNIVFSVNKTGTGRTGRGKGTGGERGRRSGRGRGRSRPINANSESTDGSASNDSDIDVQKDKTKALNATPKLRRSTRPLKQVQYAEDFGFEENDEAQNQSDDELQDVVAEQEPIGNDGRHTTEDSTVIDKQKNPFSEDCSSREYLLSGGGFCVDEDDAQGDAALTNPNQDSPETPCEDGFGNASGRYSSQHSPENGSSRDYFISGGGFCMDEDNEQVDGTLPASSQIKDVKPSLFPDISEAAQNLDLPNSVPDNAINVLEPLQATSPLVEDGRSYQHSKTSGLSAMPSLRRKRKRT